MSDLTSREIFQPNAGHIILPRRFVDVEPPSGKVGLSGEYNLRVIRGDGSVKSETGWFPNIILDAGLNRWGTGTIIAGAAVGTGTSTPTVAQTGLDAQVTYTTTLGVGAATTAQGSAPYYTSRTIVYRTALGALNGEALSEVSVGWATGSSMFSRALILDGGGSPTTITVLTAEQLDIIYRLRGYPPDVDTSSVHTIGAVSYTVAGRASAVTDAGSWPVGITVAQFSTIFTGTVYAGTFGSITGTPSGAGASAGLSTTNAYSNNSLQRTGFASMGLAAGNVSGGIRSFRYFGTLGAFQYDFGASIPKDDTKTLVLNKSFNWARRP